METQAITAGVRLVITKGCAARKISKGITVTVTAVEHLGAEYSHAVRVAIRPVNGFEAGKAFSFYARHANRLSDSIVRMNDGNPSHVIEARRAR